MSLTRKAVVYRAVPIILANASVPILGLADTAMLGFFGNTQDLAALAVVNIVFNLLFWSFGFLRMSTTGLIAQHSDQNQTQNRQIILTRSLSIALVLAFFLLMFQLPLGCGVFQFFGLAPTTEALAKSYFEIRIWSAPATLVYYCLCGVLIGMGRSGWLLTFQITLNALNIGFNFCFVYYLDTGVTGLALGTLISEYTTVLIALWFISKRITPIVADVSSPQVRRLVYNWIEVKRLLSLNRDIFIRTLFLLLSFFWFTRQSTLLGDTIVASNQILLALISFSAFFLDGFAFVAEAEIGKHYGKRDLVKLKQAVRFTTEAAALTAVSFALISLYFNEYIINLLTNIQPIQEQAAALMPYASIYIGLSFAAFQLDGIFIGATQAKAMRNASVISFYGFIASYYLLTYIDPLQGLWLSFISYVVFRAISLGFYYPKLLKTCRGLL